MKKIVCSCLIILAVMLLLPLTAMKSSPAAESVFAAVTDIPKASLAVSDRFKVCNTQTDEITELSAADYIFGVVAAEMPALYEPEALKAQAVAAYTYACYRRAENSEKSYDITNDHTTDQSYISEADAANRWGEKAAEYTEKIKKAVSETSGYMITFEDKPVLAVYHAVSSGKTESCKSVWGKDIPYLRPVNSTGDKLSPNYISTLEISAEELVSKLSPICEFSGEAGSYFGECSRTDSGYVEEITLCNEKVRGARVQSLLGLHSANFEVKYTGSGFTFTVYGYGHGVGMSQYGANYMAQQGSNFEEILTSYYDGCKVEKIP